jgi:hypothetical protein
MYMPFLFYFLSVGWQQSLFLLHDYFVCIYVAFNTSITKYLTMYLLRVKYELINTTSITQSI